jgi:hypothetical protein
MCQQRSLTLVDQRDRRSLPASHWLETLLIVREFHRAAHSNPVSVTKQRTI